MISRACRPPLTRRISCRTAGWPWRGLLAQKLGVAELVDEHVALHGAGAANGGAKALTVIGAALACGDCIDDVDVLRAGASPRLFDPGQGAVDVGDVAAVVHLGGVRQLDRVTRTLLCRAWAAGLGPDLDADLTIDIDSTVVETYGLTKQGGQRFSSLGCAATTRSSRRWRRPVSCCTPGCAAATPPPAAMPARSFPRRFRAARLVRVRAPAAPPSTRPTRG